MSERIVLFDIPSKTGRCWSANVWKARAALNFKKLDYETRWVEFPDIAPTMKKLGIPPNADGAFAAYSCPVVRFPDGSYIMESDDIVRELERLYPTPSLHLDNGMTKKTYEVFHKLAFPLFPYLMPLTRKSLLTDTSGPWYKQDREKRFGMPEEQWEAEYGGEKAWKEASQHFPELIDLVTNHKQDAGPFITGSKMCYADLIIVGFLRFFHCMGEGPYKRLTQGHKALEELYEASAGVLERDS